jgi:C4-dicarboxylate-specific signal transduction histidine kinase
VIADVLRTADEAVVGIFCAKYSFSVHSELIDAHEEHTSHADLYLLDEEGRVACSSFKHAHEANYGEHLDHQHRKFEATEESWSKKYGSESGEEVLAAFAPIKGLGWGVLVEVPTTHALHGLEHLKIQAFALSGLLAAVLTLVIFLTARRLARQLRRLSSAASRIAGGALGDRVPTNGPEEVAELATAFNQMSVSLHDSHRLLEKRIAERTRELRENQEFTELLLDSIHQRVVVIGRDRRIIKANRAARRMYGRDLTGELYDEAFEGRAEPRPGNPVTLTLESGEPAQAERLQRTPNGQEILLVQTYPVDTKGDRVESVVEIARVITDEKQLQAQMTHHEKMAAFGLLAAGVAHEIGNPLASIQAQLRMSREARDPERTGQTLEVVDKEVARIGRLLRELVEFARRRRDEVVLVSLNRVVDDVVRLLGHDPRARNVRIETDLSSGLPGVRAREDDLVQVLLNLGINALDAMPDGGSLTFETAHIDGDVLVRVLDTGAGITREARAHLFEPFFTTKAPGRGTGLGLFVSKGIVEALAGRLELESSGHAGSVFRVVLNTDGSGQKSDSMRG